MGYDIIEQLHRRNSENVLMIYLLFLSVIATSYEFYLSMIDQYVPLMTSMWDELIVAFIFVYTIVKRYGSYNRQSEFLYLLGLISIIGFIGNYKTHSSLKVMILGLYSFMKPLLLFWSLCQYQFRWKDFMKLMNLFTLFFPIILVSYILDFISPSFREMMGLGNVDIRAGIRSLGGLFRKQTIGVLWAQVFCIFYLYYSLERSRWKSYVSIAIIFLSLKVKDIFGFVMGWPTLLVRKIKTVYLFIAMSMIFVFFNLYAIIMPQHYENYFQESDNSNVARVVLTYTSLKISMDYFPFGVGFGKFASPVSRDTQSEIYHQYGIDHVYGLTFDYLKAERNRNFMCDTFWPMILGELGILGTICYLFLLGYAFYPFLKRYIKNTHDKRVLFPSVLFIMFLMTTIGKPVLMGPPHSLVLWGLAGIFYSLKDKRYPYKQIS